MRNFVLLLLVTLPPLIVSLYPVPSICRQSSLVQDKDLFALQSTDFLYSGMEELWPKVKSLMHVGTDDCPVAVMLLQLTELAAQAQARWGRFLCRIMYQFSRLFSSIYI